jgi:4-amino-4-deoxy-L-arabinose transferase-like glycosyltransferase
MIGYALLAVIYVLATPPLEASDEYKHYPVVQYVQTQKSLPVLDPDEPGKWLQEAAQPPLYYLLMASVTGWIDSGDLEEVHQVNPHAFVGDPNQIGNKNLIIHEPEREAFPWQGTVLAVYFIRFVSIALGLGAIWITALLGALLFGPKTGLVAAVLVAFNPMFIFVNAAVNNDALAILLGQLGLYMLVLMWRDAPDPRRQWWRYVLFGLVLGLGILTKLSLGGLLFLSGLALAGLAWRRKNWRLLIMGGGIVLVVALFVISPWLLRNLRLYGDPTGLNVFVAVQATRDSAITLTDWVGEFGTFYRSFWGLFGGVNVAAPEPFYVVYNLVAVIAAVGFLYWLWKHWKQRPDGLWLLVAWPMILFGLLIRWNITAPAFQGRLIFPALGALSVLWAQGLLTLVPSKARGRLTLAFSVAAFVVAALLPWLIIRPAYVFPEPLDAVPEEARFGPITFQTPSGEIKLVGLEMAPGQDVTPDGKPIEVILYWQASDPIHEDYLSTAHLLGREFVSVGQVDRFPASGMVPTSHWLPEQIWRDVYHIYTIDDAIAPALLRLQVALYDPELEENLSAYGPDGEPIELLLVGEARLAAGREMELSPTNSLDAALADGITLGGYDLNPQPAYPGEMLQVTLYWQATGRPSKGYTVFIHLLDTGGNQVAVADGPPVNGDYPTYLWRAGEQIVDDHIMTLPADLPPGEYQMAVGLYDPATLNRVPLLNGQGDAIFWPVTVEAK